MEVGDRARGEDNLEPYQRNPELLSLRPRVFILQDFYLPGEKVGGPVWTIANMVERIGDRFEFMIAALDRDFMSNTPYSSIERNAWNRVGKASVFYASQLSSRNIVRLIRDSAPDILYLNSFFGRPTVTTLILRWLRRIPNIPVVLAPHGEFSDGALRLKAQKKRAYIAFARMFNLCRDVTWHASTTWEEKEIKDTVGHGCCVHIAPELSPLSLPENANTSRKAEKLSGQLRMVYLSRITPKKNLQYALEMLRSVQAEIVLDIFGPVEDRSYWNECLQTISRHPHRAAIRYGGVLPHERVLKTLSQYHLFLLPTLGENFGYAILEALTAGCPVMISNRTPWRDLAAKRVGWDLPLDAPESWKAALRQAAALDHAAHASYSNAARGLAREWVRSPDLERQSVELFQRARETRKPNARGFAGTETYR